MITATVLLAETLVLKSVYMGVVYLLPRYELVECVGGVQGSSQEGSEVKGGGGNGSDRFLRNTELLPNMARYDD
jgi:hypothetical protein